MIKKLLFPVLCAGLAATVLAGCGSNPSSSGNTGNSADNSPIKIGVLEPFNGPNAQGGITVYNGVKLAVDLLNEKGGINGRKIQLFTADAEDATQGITAAEKLITQDHVDILTGTYVSAVSYAASQVAAKYHKLYWETNALAMNITDRGLNNVIRVGPNALGFALQTVNTIKDVLSKTLGKPVDHLNVAITHEQSVYGTSIGDKVNQDLKALGTRVSGNFAYDPKAASVAEIVTKLKNADPDIWVTVGYVNDTILLLQTAKNQGWQPPAIVLVGTGDSTEFLEGLGSQGMNHIIVVGYPRYDMNEKYAQGVSNVEQAYEKKFGSSPSLPQSLTAFGGMQVLFQLLQETGSTDVDKLREAALKLDIPMGGATVTGYGVKFDPKTLDNTRALPVVNQWQNGKVVTIYPVEARKNDVTVTGLPLKGWNRNP